MKLRTRLAAVAATATLAVGFGVAACSDDSSPDAEGTGGGADDGTISTVATTTQICDYVTQIGSSQDAADAGVSFTKTDSEGQETHAGADESDAKLKLDLTCLLAPNASAHEHEMTPQQMKALSDADLFMVSGVDLEHFLDSAVESSGFKGTMVVTSGVLTAAEVDDLPGQEAKEKDLPYTIDRGVEKVEVAKWPFPPENPGEEPEFQYDPHVWTSPKNAAIQVRNIGNALDNAAPEGTKDAIETVVDRYSSSLEDLDKWVADSIASVPEEHRVLFTSHDAFGYFSKSYGVKFIGAALSDFNAQQDATADHIKAQAEEVKKSGAVALFAENSNNSKSIEAIADAAGVKAIIGDDALYGDSLGPTGSAGETYEKSIVHNVTTLVEAWDGTPAELPDSVK